jgi:primosomal protein N' (replication factor Y)
MNIVRVALDLPRDELFDYACGELDPVPGALVVVPLGRRRQVGVAVERAPDSSVPRERLRRVERVVPIPPLPADVLALARFCAGYYRAPLGQVLAAALPTALRRPGASTPGPVWEYAITETGRATETETLPKRAVAARRLLQELQQEGSLHAQQMKEYGRHSRRILDQWVEAGLVERRPVQPAATCEPASPAGEMPVLSADQRRAVEHIGASFGGYSPWLLQGVTGSGKTEVYLQLVSLAQSRATQSLVLVPEINLTPQLEARLRARFPRARIVGLHSGLTEAQRLARWELARSGEADLVVGTRLAVFTPMPRLGLIVVDEEHDSSFKQQEGLRYHARDAAVVLARQRRVPIVLGSATPSLETLFNARSGRFGWLRLEARPAARMPVIRAVDPGAAGTEAGLSAPVIEALESRLSLAQQSLVYVNRRGYSPVLLCAACGWTAQCLRCAARLTVHLRAGRLRCHYCGHEQPISPSCPECGNQDLRGLGQGTQRVEEALAARFPVARILRVDSDSTRRRHSFARMRERIHADAVDILVGTQMLAKGHDFPKLTLVVVLGADHGLFSSDFRAAEKLFQQLTQVAGRAGRANLPGEALIQTRFPAHPLYQALARHDYDAFARELLDERERFGFPPFRYQAVLRAEAVHEKAVRDFLEHAAREARSVAGAVTVYDPVPALMPRLAGRHRAQLLAQSSSRRELQQFLAAWHPRLRAGRASSVRWALDVDPIEL